ncbi:hypothetical protein EZS27_018837 [termite gut metagenome]|uniref:DUF4199 domain-containing protein n=1 Tax=termite gut metagenome TaxID=433724 RepID=A0A5J4RGR5_9ZZZZ
MANNRINTQKYAMSFGTYMGLFWIAKFSLFPLGLTNPFLLILFLGLTLAVPFMGCYYARMFRDKVCGGEIRFIRAWIFMIFMYMFAALLTAMAHYIYFRFIDKGFIVNTYIEILDSGAFANISGIEEYMTQWKEGANLIRSMTPIELTLNLMSQNVFYCTILSLIIAPFVMKKNTSKDN